MADRPREPSIHGAALLAHAAPTAIAAHSPPTAPPVGEDRWLDFIDQQRRRAHDLESRIQIIELYKKGVTGEFGSLNLWLSYCEYFWALYQSSQHPGHNGLPTWSPDELPTARDIFSLDSALRVWQEGHEATQYRLSDSHELWNRWINKELDLLSRTRTADGIKRITHLFRNRLTIPHKTWSETSQFFSTFLSEYNHSAWEESMQDITARSQPARDMYEQRDSYEMKLAKAVNLANIDAQKAAINDYLQFEITNTVRERKSPRVAVQIALGLFSRALTGLLANDEASWTDYVVFVSTLNTRFNSPESRDPDMLHIIPDLPVVLQAAVTHCPWSGTLWARYMLSCEEAGASFPAMERIKHAATDSAELDRDGMVSVIDMYAAWCGYLKRSALDPAATEEMADLADSGLVAALEAVQVWGERRFGTAYVGDPNFRLERILISYLTEKHKDITEARSRWAALGERPLYATSYNFWLQFYVWELSVFESEKGKTQTTGPRTAVPAKLRTPVEATRVLQKALRRKDLDWPERILDVYLQHCNDYESPETLRLAYDLVHRTGKQIERRRQGEAAAAATHAAALAAQSQTEESHDSPASKRKREDTSPERPEGANKRPRNSEDVDSVQGGDEAGQSQAAAANPKRDREHTSVIVTNLPADTTQTRVRQYFREYGHINSLVLKKVDEEKSAVAVIEFRSPEDARSALLRDGKYFGQQLIEVKPGTDLTLFVTNFPPTADEAFIRGLFKDCGGDVFDVRWPSLKFNTHRRFCYVTFRDGDVSREAVKLNGKLLQGKYKLSVKYSDPSQKKSREGATSEGREVKVRNLPLDADEDAVKEVFGKMGQVQTVRVLRNVAGKSQGTGFVVYATKDEAEKAAAELNGVKLRNSILAVETTKAVNYKPQARTAGTASPAPDEEGDLAMGDATDKADREAREQRTFALLGVPDTVNDSRVKALVEKHAGDGSTIVKLILRPDHGGAIVEMADQATAGKAQLALAGVEIDGRPVRTGTVAELLGEKGVVKTDRVDKGKEKKMPLMMAPPRVNRPVLGGPKPKRGGAVGLGFFPKAATNGDSRGTSSTAGGGQKSNSQFRDMFLKGKDGEETKAEEATK